MRRPLTRHRSSVKHRYALLAAISLGLMIASLLVGRVQAA
jgi:hypothetical protein